jgi:hypothetical protein
MMPVLNNQNEMEQIVIVMRDITQIKKRDLGGA